MIECYLCIVELRSVNIAALNRFRNQMPKSGRRSSLFCRLSCLTTRHWRSQYSSIYDLCISSASASKKLPQTRHANISTLPPSRSVDHLQSQSNKPHKKEQTPETSCPDYIARTSNPNCQLLAIQIYAMRPPSVPLPVARINPVAGRHALYAEGTTEEGRRQRGDIERQQRGREGKKGEEKTIYSSFFAPILFSASSIAALSVAGPAAAMGRKAKGWSVYMKGGRRGGEVGGCKEGREG